MIKHNYRMKTILGAALLTLFLVTSCKVEPEEINYGKDGCHFCSMTIVDNQHASELVTAKAKVYKYDAIECLINDLKRRDSTEVGMLLVNDYSHPGDLISAETATFLISEGVPSPMGAFLSGFSNKADAEAVKSENGGELFDWQAVQKQIK
jgi:copper chaperone NosL